MAQDPPIADQVRETRQRIARHMADLHRLHLLLVQEGRALKRYTVNGHAVAEIELTVEMLEQYLGESSAFLENMRGRYEARLPMLRRGEPQRAGFAADEAPGHGQFWLSFSRLCAVLRRVEKRVSD